MHRTAFLQSARSRSCWPVGMNGMVAEAAYSKSGWITETKNCLLAVGVRDCPYVRRKAPILRPTFVQIESTWGDQERLSSMIIPRRRVCETSLTSSDSSEKSSSRRAQHVCPLLEFTGQNRSSGWCSESRRRRQGDLLCVEFEVGKIRTRKSAILFVRTRVLRPLFDVDVRAI